MTVFRTIIKYCSFCCCVSKTVERETDISGPTEAETLECNEGEKNSVQDVYPHFVADNNSLKFWQSNQAVNNNVELINIRNEQNYWKKYKIRVGSNDTPVKEFFMLHNCQGFAAVKNTTDQPCNSETATDDMDQSNKVRSVKICDSSTSMYLYDSTCNKVQLQSVKNDPDADNRIFFQDKLRDGQSVLCHLRTGYYVKTNYRNLKCDDLPSTISTLRQSAVTEQTTELTLDQITALQDLDVVEIIPT